MSELKDFKDGVELWRKKEQRRRERVKERLKMKKRKDGRAEEIKV